MAGTYNKIIIVGNLVRDPEGKDINGGKRVVNFTVAVNRPIGKNAPEGAQTVDYFPINAWDNLGKTCETYLKKGMPVLVEGAMQLRNFTDKDGNKRTSAEILAREMQMMSNKGQAENAAPSEDASHASAAHVNAPSEKNEQPSLEDEIPF